MRRRRLPYEYLLFFLEVSDERFTVYCFTPDHLKALAELIFIELMVILDRLADVKHNWFRHGYHVEMIRLLVGCLICCSLGILHLKHCGSVCFPRLSSYDGPSSPRPGLTWINLPRYPAPPLPGPTIPSRSGLPDIKPPDDLSVLITSVCCGELETIYLGWGSGYRREDRRGSSPIQGLRLSRSPSNRNVGQRYSKPPLPPRGMAGPRFLESCRIDYQRSMGLPRQSPV